MPRPPSDGLLTWTDDGQPRSRLYDDVYFSREDGLAEARAVFLQGCGLPEAWAGRRRFVVGELGFGSGLNILALLELWRRRRPEGARLRVFSVEAHPLTASEAGRALALWPEVADLAALLVARWPGRARGFHRIDLPEADAVLDVAVMEAAEALDAWSGQADAWFLDGFAPARNPAMWRDEVLAGVAARSAPDARAATFTVAGGVRRGLAAQGFSVEKRPGFGRKRERLEARRGGAAAVAAPTGAVAIVGGGIAGASAARALRMLGIEPLLVEAEHIGAGASGNRAALVTARLDAGLGPAAQLFAHALARAGALYEAIEGAVLSRGVLQLVQDPRDTARFSKIAGSDLFEPDALAVLEADETSARLGEPAPPALDMRQARVIDPARVLAAWAGPALKAHVDRLSHAGGRWRLLGRDGGVIAEADHVILAGGPDAARLAPSVVTAPVRGQVSWVAMTDAPPAAAWGGYAAPTPGGLLFGATHDRGDSGTDLRPDDDRKNRENLAKALPGLAARIADEAVESRASIRAVTPDRLPLAGPVADAPPGLHVLGGFGARGFALAPLLAEHVAAGAAGAPSPLPAALAALVDPARFARRAARRGHS
jgi:tRNA 5-methylaminomethyl-2-thiouridine biosynthesis bifunctional protein